MWQVATLCSPTSRRAKVLCRVWRRDRSTPAAGARSCTSTGRRCRRRSRLRRSVTTSWWTTPPSCSLSALPLRCWCTRSRQQPRQCCRQARSRRQADTSATAWQASCTTTTTRTSSPSPQRRPTAASQQPHPPQASLPAGTTCTQ